MNPILFAENSTTFTTNGIGRLSDTIKCEVTEERNGEYTLEMSYPITGVHYEDISVRSILYVKLTQNSQAFRVYKITRPINGRVTIYANHISYDLNKNTTMPISTITASSSACSQALAAIKSNAVESCPFNFSTDVTTVNSFTLKTPGSIRSCLGGVEGSILDQFHGEFEFDNFNVILHESRGSVKNIPLRYGKNIIDLTQEENIANTITGIVPYWVDLDETQVVTLPEKAVYSSNASLYSQNLTVPHDFSSEWDDRPTEAQLRSKATVYMNQTGVGIPKVNIKISFVNLPDTEEYKDLLSLQQVELCDTIPVVFEPLGINTTAKIVKTTYDVLAERYSSIEVGEPKSTLASTITDANSEMVASTDRKFAKVAGEVDNATAWLTGSNGYVIAVKNDDGTWKELIFADHNDPDEWVNVLRINENGLGFSSDGGVTYTQAWTLDGKLVIGGTNVPSITCYDSNGNVLFKADRSAVVMNSTGTDTYSGTTFTRGLSVANGKMTFTKNGTTGTTIGSGSEGKGCYINTQEFSVNATTTDNDGSIYLESDVGMTIRGDDEFTVDYNAGGVTIDVVGSATQSDRLIQFNAGGGKFKAYAKSISLTASKSMTISSTGDDVNITGNNVYLSGNNLATGTMTDSYGTQWVFENGLLVDIIS